MPAPKRIFKMPFELITFLMMFAALYAIFFYAPVEKTMGLVQKVFYIHVPAAFLAFLGFFITFIASILYLYKRDDKWDAAAFCSAEIGVIFCTIVLITGPIWAKPIWNVWWTWDPRLTTTLILWFIYVAYLMLRSVVRENQRANFSAVFGIIGFVNVPITFLAIRLWRSIHPVLITSRGINISTPMKHTLALTFLAFCLLFFALLKTRIKLEKMRMDTEIVNALVEEKLYYQTN
ncbi:MAG: cytochrome c biogenesis protein CcsA [Thermodesulfobacteriota bacterium]|nr:MAG: cytochrome c biogenesis protein CcsA [Thermodesulfobacteriota bacterium]